MIPSGATFISMIRLWALAAIFGTGINQISQIIMKGVNVNKESLDMEKRAPRDSSWINLGDTLSVRFCLTIGIIMSIVWLIFQLNGKTE